MPAFSNCGKSSMRSARTDGSSIVAMATGISRLPPGRGPRRLPEPNVFRYLPSSGSNSEYPWFLVKGPLDQETCRFLLFGDYPSM